MGIGDNVIQMEENLLKIWVLSNHGYFTTKGKNQELWLEDEGKLLEMIRSHFQNESPFRKLESLQEISELLDNVKKRHKTDLIAEVEDYELEPEENGGAHKVITPRGLFVFPDP